MSQKYIKLRLIIRKLKNKYSFYIFLYCTITLYNVLPCVTINFSSFFSTTASVAIQVYTIYSKYKGSYYNYVFIFRPRQVPNNYLYFMLLYIIKYCQEFFFFFFTIVILGVTKKKTKLSIKKKCRQSDQINEQATVGRALARCVVVTTLQHTNNSTNSNGGGDFYKLVLAVGQRGRKLTKKNSSILQYKQII